MSPAIFIGTSWRATAASYATEVTIPGIYGAQRSSAIDPFASPAPDFQSMVQHLVPLTLLLNSLTRSLGQPDAYPFALAGEGLVKLRFVHDVVRDAARRPAPVAAPAPQPAPAPKQNVKKNSKTTSKDVRQRHFFLGFLPASKSGKGGGLELAMCLPSGCWIPL